MASLDGLLDIIKSDDIFAAILEYFTSSRCRWNFLVSRTVNCYPRAWNFHPYWLLVIISFSCISFLKIKKMDLIVALMNALNFYSSIWIYAFIHKWSNDVIWLHTVILKIPWRHWIWYLSQAHEINLVWYTRNNFIYIFCYKVIKVISVHGT